MKRIYILLALLLAALPHSALAQEGARINLRDLQSDTFPTITGYFDARDASGMRLADLTANDLQVFEDGVAQPVEQVRSVQPGLRVILVLTPGESFNIRNSEAQTRFDLVKQSIKDWASALSAGGDTLLSLLTPEGSLVQDGVAPEWLAALDSYQLPAGVVEINTQTLTQAIDLASQPTEQPGVGVAIWWVTATPRVEALTALPEWQTSLVQAGIPLFIWQVDSPSTFESEAGLSLQALADASGGQRFVFSGPETFPAPEDYFASLRDAYFFQYSSQLRTAGEHSVSLQLQLDQVSVASQALTFALDIQAPSPILVSPPAQIERAPSDDDPQQLAPFSQPIEIVVEFPDGFERNLVRSTLYVNDDVVAENSTAPFNHFAWDLSSYMESQQVFLRVEVEDELGLVGSSIEFPVQFSVQTPAGWFQALLARGATTLALSVVLIAAGAFFLVMVLSGRLDPSQLRVGKLFDRQREPVVRPMDPLRDSPAGIEESADGDQFANPALASEAETPAAPAYLQRLTMQDPNVPAFVQPLGESELLIGSEAANDLVLTDPSVDKQHARLTHKPNGEYQLADLGSHAGTWVNYAPVSGEGSRLRDGDIVHIGRVAFRFLLNHKDN